MTLGNAVTAGLFLLLALGTGCARLMELRAETVANAEGESFWVAGSEGFAAFHPGTGSLQRRDYPRAPGAPNYAYEPFLLPAAHLLVTSGQTFLFTRHGDVLLWQSSAWSRVPVKLEADSSGDVQVDEALETPEGRILLHLHSSVLLRATPAELRRGVYHRETTPGYVSWLGFFDGTLYAIGCDPGGNRRAIHRQEAPGRWTMLGLLPEGELLMEESAMIQMPGGQLAVVAGAGLYRQRPDGYTDLLRVEALLKKPAVVAGPAAEDAPPSKAPTVAADVPPQAPAPATIAGALEAPTPAVAPSPPPSLDTSGLYLLRAFSVKGHGPLLLVGGPTPGVLELDERGARFARCNEAPAVTGAVAVPRGLRLVTSDAAILELRGDGCPRLSPPILGEAGMPGSPPRSP